MARATSIVTESKGSPNKRSKPLKYAYEKEIVLYAHHKKLDYFSTECIYSPEAFRGSARTLIKNMERIRPRAILDIVRSGEDMAKLVPKELAGSEGCSGQKNPTGVDVDEEEGMGGCGSTEARSSGGEMITIEGKLSEDQAAEDRETEITSTIIGSSGTIPDRPTSNHKFNPGSSSQGQRHDRDRGSKICSTSKKIQQTSKKLKRSQMGQCARCGYLSSQEVCKACMLLEGLNKNRPKMQIEVGLEDEESSSGLGRGMERVALNDI